MYRFIKTTVVGGVLVLLPIAACVYVIAAFAGTVQRIIHPIMELLPVKGPGRMIIEEVLAVAIVLAVCFLFGLAVRTRAGQALGRRMENTALNRVPGYRLFKQLTHQVAGDAGEALGAPVLVRLEDSRQIGFLVEEHASGDVTVFIPDAPTLATGSVQIVRSEQVARLNVPLAKVMNCITRFGVGTSRLLSAPDDSPASNVKGMEHV